MSTHGCILVKGEHYPEGILLHTSHSGTNIPQLVSEAPKVVANKWKTVYKDREAAKHGLERNGDVEDWLFEPTCVCSLLITVRPCMLTHVFNNDASEYASWSGADDPWILEIDGNMWKLISPQDEDLKAPTKIIDVVEIFINEFPEIANENS